MDGFALSKTARTTFDAPEYCYGEIEFISFIALLSLCEPTKDTVFYDLGSGVGKAAIACAMVYDVKQSTGVELFDELHQAALLRLEHLQQLPGYAEKASRVLFLQTDLCEVPLHDAALIFINASAFFGALWDKISLHCEQVSSGTRVVTTSKPLRSDVFSIEKQTLVEMSWGVVKAYIQVKI